MSKDNPDPPNLQLHKAEKDKEEVLALLGNLELMKKQLPVILEMQQLMATVTFNKFKQLRAAGFTEEQALKLCNKSDLI